MDKELFDDAIGEVPPSTVDVDAAIARGRRAVWTRRVMSPVTAVAAAVVLVTGGIAFTILPGDSATGTAPVAPTTGTTSSRMHSVPGIDAETCPDEDPATTARLMAAANAAILARLPEDTELEEEPPELCFPYELSWRVNYTQHIGVHVVDRDGVPASTWTCQTTLPCRQLSGPNGEVILTSDNYPTGGYGTSVIKTGSTEADVTEVGVYMFAEEGQGPPLLSHDQLIEIGLDAGLTLDP